MNMNLENKKKIEGILLVANTHAERIKSALDYVARNNLAPVSVAIIHKFNFEDMAAFELLTNRFAKLQDHLGAKVFPLILDLTLENDTSYTNIDRLNKLEKINYLESAEKWHEMRVIRNHFTHEYPDNIDLTVSNLNQAIEISRQLLLYWDGLKEKINKLL